MQAPLVDTDPYVEALPEPVQNLLGVEYLGNSLDRWAIALIVFAGVLLVLFLLRRLAVNRLTRLSERTDTDIDDLVRDVLKRTKTLVLLVIALSIAGRTLVLSPGVELFLHRLLFIALAIQAGIWLSQVLTWVVERYLRRREEEPAVRVAVLGMFSFFGRVAIWSIVLLLCLDNFGFDVTALIAGLGVGGIAVGLALQNVLQDTFASLSIVLDKPFEVGDFIVLGDFAGNVERIGLKTTRIRSLSGEQLVFGNGDLLNSRIRNFKVMSERRIVFHFGVLYQTTADQLEAIPGMVREIFEGVERARLDRAHFFRFGDSSLDFEIVYWVESPEYLVYMDIQQQVNLALVRRFEAEGIDFAYPTRTLYIEGGEAPPAGEEGASGTAGETASAGGAEAAAS